MKKVYVILAVAAMVCMSSMALAADITLGGTVQLRSRDFSNLSLDKTVNKDQVDTQTRFMTDVNVKAGDVKAKISIWNDWNTWSDQATTLSGNERQEGLVSVATSSSAGHTHTFTNNNITAREAWLLFPVADTGFFIKGGHQLLQLGHGGFFRAMHFGDDAWVVYRDDGPNHFGFVNVKVLEGLTSQSDDVDAYVIVDTFKLNENNKIGADLTMLNDRKNAMGFGGQTHEAQAQNLSFNYTGKAGIVNLKAQLDVQSGKAKSDAGDMKFKGNEIFVKGDVAMDPVTVNFTVARGSGPKIGQTDYNEMITILDTDPHYTFLYEYKIGNPSCKTATNSTGIHTGFCNTTAVNAGAKFAATKNLSVGADLWFLQSTEKMAKYNDAAATTNDIGMEADVNITWKLAENLTWSWNLGYFDPGDAMGKDAATGIQGIVAFNF